MKLKNKLKKTFPYLSQYYYERRTDALVRKYASEDPVRREANLRALYRRRVGAELCLAPPGTYTEKLQWRKLHGLGPEHSLLSDKYAVRAWVAERIGEEYLVPLLGVWDTFDEIPLATLPESFVLKTTNGSAANLIVREKGRLDVRLARRKFGYWLSLPYWYAWGYEMQYAAITPRILGEQYLGDDLWDYKFLCFHGKVRFIWVDTGRYSDHTRYMFYPDWTPAPFNQNYPIPDTTLPRPDNLPLMCAIAEKLSAEFDHVRVDLYDREGSVYFGEMTFTNGSGLEPIHPSSWDRILGEMWDIGNG